MSLVFSTGEFVHNKARSQTIALLNIAHTPLITQCTDQTQPTLPLGDVFVYTARYSYFVDDEHSVASASRVVALVLAPAKFPGSLQLNSGVTLIGVIFLAEKNETKNYLYCVSQRTNLVSGVPVL